MHAGVHPQGGCDTVKGQRFHDADVIKWHPHLHRVRLEGGRPARAVNQDGQTGPGFWEDAACCPQECQPPSTPLAAGIIGLQHHPVRVPDVAIVTQVAIAVSSNSGVSSKSGWLVTARGQNSAFGLKAHHRRIKAGYWPNIRKHGATASLPDAVGRVAPVLPDTPM